MAAALSVFGQNTKTTSKVRGYTNLTINAAFQLPAGDLVERFGSNLRIGGGFNYLSFKNFWFYGLDAHFLFGQTVKEDVLKTLRTTEGAILSDIGSYADVFLRQRGFQMQATVGKIFALADNGNKIKGIRLAFGVGFLQHRIKIQDQSKAVAALFSPYTEGYDRLTNGVALSQSIGYQIISRDKTLNIYVALESSQAFTKNRRGFNFDTRTRDDAQRIDILYGVTVGLSVPIFSRINPEEIEY